MKFLITGGAGFIGSHLSDRLLKEGYSVKALDDLSTGRHDNISHLSSNKNFTFVLGSVLDDALVDELTKNTDCVIHLAAAVGVDLIISRPLESLATNIRGSEIVLESAHKHGKPILVSSTSEIYGKNVSDSLDEETDRILGSPLKTRWSYSEAKAIEEVLAYTYWRTKGLPTKIVRLFNTVGPRQTGMYGMVIPRFTEAALNDWTLRVFGTGKQTRCFCHIDDVIDALVKIIFSDSCIGQVVNVGNNQEISIYALAEEIIKQTNSSSSINLIPYSEAYEEGFEDMERRVPNISKVTSLTGWKPFRTLNDIIKDVSEDILTNKHQ